MKSNRTPMGAEPKGDDLPAVTLTREQASRLTGCDFSDPFYDEARFIETTFGMVEVTTRSWSGFMTSWLRCLAGQRSIRWEVWKAQQDSIPALSL